MTMNKTSILSESSSSSSLTPSTPHGLRSQIGHILPKHAQFRVRIYIDQLSNVPLVNGEFGVRWKFKNVQSPAGLLAKMKPRSVSSPSAIGVRRDKGKGRMEPHVELSPEHDARSRSSHSSYDDDDDDDPEHHVDTSFSSHSNGSATYGQFLTASPPETPVPASAAPTITKVPPMEKHAEARGMTEWAQLKNYSARWDYTIDTVVQMDVHRETLDLLPSELKLVVMQRVVQGDPNAPQQPRLGAVYINLAEYADVGPVTRRYLLRESKTNATLKLTVTVEHVAGARNYRPPPLRKGEIMASVTGLLSNNDLYHTKLARNLDLYTRADDEDWTDGYPRTPLYSSSDGNVDFDRLATSNGLRTTENLIDALFNPMPSSSPNPSPFTYYDPDKAKQAETVAWAVERQSTHSSVDSSFTDTSSHNPSLYTAGSEHSSGSGHSLQEQPSRHWWQPKKSRSSRPGTPGDRTGTLRPSTPLTNGFPRVPS